MAKKIACLCEQFLNMNGDGSCLFGGGERWWYDFIQLLKQMGYDVECYQFSQKKWTQRYKNLVIKGLGNISQPISNPVVDYPNGINEFYKLTEDCNGIFFLSMNLAIQTPKKPTLSVSHGLMFDYKRKDVQQIHMLDAFKKWIRSTNFTISVDTNSIHVMQVYDVDIAKKMTYIPNYVSLNEFTPSNDWLKTDRFRILYPRRLQSCRGYHIFISAINQLINKYEDMDFIFCGKGSQQDTDMFMNWYNKQDKNRVKYMWYEMKNMPQAYKEADISLIPTIFAEGTSLSALESLASGVPLVSTYTGGLSDITQNFVNGLLIQPDNVNALIEGIKYMYNNREHLKEMRENGLRMIKAFSKERWEKQVSEVVKKVFGEP